MEISVTKEKLYSGLEKIAGFATSRSTLPVLGFVLVHARHGEIELRATDLDIHAKITIPIDTGDLITEKDEAAVSVPAKAFSGILRDTRNGVITLSFDMEKHTLTILSESGKYKINGLPAEEFPPMQPVNEDGEGFSMDQTVVRRGLSKVSFAMSDDVSRYVLNGVCVEVLEREVRFVATDGRRLSTATEEATIHPSAQNASFIIPDPTVRAIERVLDVGSIDVTYTQDLVKFDASTSAGHIQVVSKLVQGSFPNYKQVIPDGEAPIVLSLPREDLIGALRRVMNVTTEQQYSVRLKLKDGNLNISVKTESIGAAVEKIPVAYTGEELVITFNPKYLVDPLKALAGDTVAMHFFDALSPGMYKEEGFLYVIMPLRTT